MKISCMKGKLMQGINNVSKAVSTKTTHPILSCIFIEAENGNIKLIQSTILIWWGRSWKDTSDAVDRTLYITA